MFVFLFFFFFKQKTAYEMRISDWSSDVCSSDLGVQPPPARGARRHPGLPQLPGRTGGHSGGGTLSQAVDRALQAGEVGRLRQAMGGALHQRHLDIAAFEGAGEAQAGLPRHIGVLHAVNEAHRAAERDRPSEQQVAAALLDEPARSEEHTSELQSLMRLSYAVFCLQTKARHHKTNHKNMKTP